MGLYENQQYTPTDNFYTYGDHHLSNEYYYQDQNLNSNLDSNVKTNSQNDTSNYNACYEQHPIAYQNTIPQENYGSMQQTPQNALSNDCNNYNLDGSNTQSTVRQY